MAAQTNGRENRFTAMGESLMPTVLLMRRGVTGAVGGLLIFAGWFRASKYTTIGSLVPA
jgi:hypothetical protein